MNERRNRTAEIAVSLSALGLCLAAGLWLFGDTERRGPSTGPRQEAVAAEPRAKATLALPRAAPADDERRAAADDARPNAAPEPAPKRGPRAGAVEGVFLTPRSLPGDALVTLTAFSWSTAHEVRSSSSFPASEPWRKELTGPGNWRFYAEVTIGDRRWSSDAVDLELAHGEERRGVTLALVECYAEGVVTNRAGLALPGAVIEIAWTKLVLDEKEPPHRAAQLVEQRARARMEDRITAFQSRRPGASRQQLEDEDRLHPPRFTTDASGYYRVPLTGPGRYGLRIVNSELIAEDAYIQVDRARPVATHDFEVAHASSLRGRVTAAGGARPESVNLFLRLDGSSNDVARNTSLLPDGTFQFERLPPGRYDFYARGGGEADQDWSHAAQLEIPEGFRATYDAVLTPSFVLEGHVMDPDPQPRQYIAARGRDNPDLYRRARVRADGTFTIRGLYAGEYVLEAVDRELVQEHTFVVDEANPPVFQHLELRSRANDR